MTMEQVASDQPVPAAAPTPLAPPTTPGALGTRARRSAWPTVISIIAITVGIGGILLNIWTAIMLVFFGRIGGVYGITREPFAAMKLFAALQGGVAIVSILVSVLLLVAGILLLQRHRRARTLLLAWAVLRSVIVPMAAYIGYLTQHAQFGAMAGSSNSPMLMTGFFGAMAVFGIAFALLLGWSFPVFIFVWLNRSRIKKETAQW